MKLAIYMKLIQLNRSKYIIVDGVICYEINVRCSLEHLGFSYCASDCLVPV